MGAGVGMILGTKEWMPNNENCMKGCQNDCLYCYGKLRAIRYKQKTAENWHIMTPNKRSTKPIRYLEGGVMFPTTHDLHIEHADIWLPFLWGLLEKGNDVLIVTKPQYAAVKLICDELSGYKNQIEFRLTIGTNDDKVAAYWEPGAPSPSDRLMALAHISTRGYKVSISMEPLLVEQPKEIIDSLFKGWVSGDIWIGLMNHHAFKVEIPEEARQAKIQTYDNIKAVYDSLKTDPQIKWKDSIRDLLGVHS